MLRIRWPVFVALALALLAPSPALADEVNPIEGFTGGVEDLFSAEAREVESDPVRDYEYEPILRAGEDATTALPEEGQEIQSVVGAVNTVTWGGGVGRSLLDSIRYLMGTNATGKEIFVIGPIGLVFMWWGIRKTRNIIMNAWRGRATV